MKRTLLLLSVIVLWSLASAQAQGAETAAPDVDSPFGINAWVASRFYTEAQREHAMQLLRAAGAAWTREEFCWACLEWSPQARPSSKGLVS